MYILCFSVVPRQPGARVPLQFRVSYLHLRTMLLYIYTKYKVLDSPKT